MKTSVYKTPRKQTGKFWLFNNGQFTEKIACTSHREWSLSYFYNRVYVNRCIVNHVGVRLNSSNVPLSDITNTVEKEICKQLFLEDQAKGIISQEYKFQ